MAVILLVRHGENEWVKKGRLAGWIPGVHLNKKGQEQALSAAARLCHLPITAIYSSPVTRCLETAQPIAANFDLPVVSLEEIGEVHYGKWEGKKNKKTSQKNQNGLSSNTSLVVTASQQEKACAKCKTGPFPPWKN